MYLFITSTKSTSTDSILRTFEAVHAFNSKLASDELLPRDVNKVFEVAQLGVFDISKETELSAKELFASFFRGEPNRFVRSALRNAEQELKVAMMYHDPFIAE